jgi:hypothetical protein
MREGRRLPSAGTVIATIALLMAMGGAAYAGAGIGKTVTANEIKAGAVTAPKIHSNAVRTTKIADNAVTGDKVNEATLGPVPLAGHALNILAATVRADGTLARASQQGTTSARNGEGSYTVDFGTNVQACTYLASLGGIDSQPIGQISTTQGTANAVAVNTFNSGGAAADRVFSVEVVC